MYKNFIQSIREKQLTPTEYWTQVVHFKTDILDDIEMNSQATVAQKLKITQPQMSVISKILRFGV